MIIALYVLVCPSAPRGGVSSKAAPLAMVNTCTRIDELERALLRLSNRNDEASRRALLWGSILYDGFRDRKKPFPSKIIDAGNAAANTDGYTVGTQAMQVWWLATVARDHLVPDLRKVRISRYSEVWRNGKKIKVPIYVSDDDDRRSDRLRRLRMNVIQAKSDDEARLVYLWWQKDTTRLVADAQIKLIVENADSPFRGMAIGELALRERKLGSSSEWATRWKQLKAKDQSLVIEATAARESKFFKK